MIGITTYYRGSISSIVAALLALLGVWWTLISRDKDWRKRVRSAAGSFLILPEGTFFIENKIDEAITISVTQKRLYEEFTNTGANDTNKRSEIYRKINAQESAWFFNEILSNGNQKFSNVDLSAKEKVEIPECEMFGYEAEKIKEVIIGTALRYAPLDCPEKYCEKLYIHRFTMGNTPEPRARWVLIYSKIRCKSK